MAELIVTISPYKARATFLKTAIVNRFNRALKLSKQDVEPRIRQLVKDKLTESDTVQEIVQRGELLGELGIPDPRQAMFNIIEKLVSQTQIRIKPISFGTKAKDVIEIFVVRSGFAEILNLDTSEYTYTMSQDGTQKTIPWLQWLLEDGDRVVVDNYYVDTSLSSGEESRTGLAVMRRDNSTGWRVPPEHSGTLDDNFITRAVTDPQLTLEMFLLFKNALERYFNS